KRLRSRLRRPAVSGRTSPVERTSLMADMRRFGPADLLLLVLVLGVAGGLRAGYLLRCADGGRSEGPLRVQDARPPLLDFTPPDEEKMRGAPRPTELDALIHNVQE